MSSICFDRRFAGNNAAPRAARCWACALKRRVALAGFTIVELLIVIAIIGLLVALLLPAIQAARESSRRTQCKNHLRQMGLAVAAHNASVRHYPTGGWGAAWVGDPDRGTGMQQPGGWIYNVLPFLEEAPLGSLGRGLSGPAKREQANNLIATALAVFNCPSRRLAVPYPHPSPYALANADPVGNVARTDYAINAGDRESNQYDTQGGPATMAAAETYLWPEPQRYTGVSFIRSVVHLRQVLDGQSKTYLVGEKYLNPGTYETGRDPGDRGTMYSGFSPDQFRVARKDAFPRQDLPDISDRNPFGSVHSSGMNFVFCDGSVRVILYTIEPEVHRRLGNRADGQVIDSVDY
jgi:prepilin-type processing-associated H-X9-DG protein/prepilin-type N-terminal cleavage/methylation domain-containing protein